MRAGRRRLLTLLTVAAAGYLGTGALITWQLTTRAHAKVPERASGFVNPVEELRLVADDGITTGAWLDRGEDGEPCVVLLHGNRDSRTAMRRVFERWEREHLCVLALSLRAHGDSDGDVNDFGYGARKDVIAAVEHLRRALPDRPIIVSGRSLGAAAALFAAPALGDHVSGYFLEQPYEDLERATKSRLALFLPSFLVPVGYFGLELWAGVFLPEPIAEISPVERASAIPSTVPVVILAGTADTRAPLAEVRHIHERFRGHGELVVFEGRGHVALDESDPERYAAAFHGLLDRVARRTP